jgi:phosphohistidine phosphatase
VSGNRDAARKHITIVRHAKSSWDEPSLADDQRPLAKRGRKSLKPMRQHLEDLGLRFDLVICSPSRRTRETLDGISEALGHVPVVFEDSIYEAGLGQLLDVLRSVDEKFHSVVLVGHNPGVGDLVDVLVDDPEASDEVGKFPTGAIAALSTTARWSGLQRGAATLDNFWSPRDSS